MEKLSDGYYWVKRNNKWQIAELLDGECWWFFGFDWAMDETEIETLGPRIMPPNL